MRFYPILRYSACDGSGTLLLPKVALMCFYPSYRSRVSGRAGTLVLSGGYLHAFLSQPQEWCQWESWDLDSTWRLPSCASIQASGIVSVRNLGSQLYLEIAFTLCFVVSLRYCEVSARDLGSQFYLEVAFNLPILPSHRDITSEISGTLLFPRCCLYGYTSLRYSVSERVGILVLSGVCLDPLLALHPQGLCEWGKLDLALSWRLLSCVRFYPSTGIVPVMDLGPCSFLRLPSCTSTPASGRVPVMDLEPCYFLRLLSWASTPVTGIVSVGELGPWFLLEVTFLSFTPASGIVSVMAMVPTSFMEAPSWISTQPQV